MLDVRAGRAGQERGMDAGQRPARQFIMEKGEGGRGRGVPGRKSDRGRGRERVEGTWLGAGLEGVNSNTVMMTSLYI